LETAPAPLELRARRGFSLFWRTFFFLSLLLFGSIVAWIQTYRALESEPRAEQSAQQLASLVNLSRAALRYSDAVARVSLIKTLADEGRVRIILRETLEEITNFGDGGRQPGQFYGVHSIATDSKGNVYTTETYEGKRVQRFVFKGVGAVPAGRQGVLWPKK
jgi:hypothetical protein